ncbi:MAG: sugar phosphate isomerase/epimerase [Clostridia bacterium]|nr:sugar phosphate isomerase/epimerase [Clostridia bacterium]
MKLGMPTLVECRDIYECVAVAQRNRLDFVEINMSFPQYQPSSLDVAALRELKERSGVFYTVHADEGLNPFDFNPRVSECYFEVMRDTVRFALALDIPIINMHLLRGIYVTLPDRVVLLNDIYSDEYLSAVRRFIDMCESEIGSSALKICIENVDTNPFTEAQLLALDMLMASPVFALTLDTGHMECLGQRDMPVFQKYPDRLLHMHLHDSDGKHAHLALGDGRIDPSEKMRLLRGETCLIEVKTISGLEKSMEYLRK